MAEKGAETTDKLTPLCQYCDKQFTRKKNLYQHMRNVHKIDVNVGTLKCPLCENFSITMDKLREHLTLVHNLTFDMEEMKFITVQDFKQWKEEEEKKTLSSFVANTAAKKVGDVNKIYYKCHRSGTFVSVGKTSRQLKSQGSVKIGSTCPSSIKAVFQHNGNVCVQYWKTHVGHEMEFSKILLTQKERAEIAGKLSEGVKMEKILDDIRNTLAPDCMKRLHFATRKDLQNIIKEFGLKQQRNHDNDLASLAIWVEKMKQLGECCPVLLYKEQGCEPNDLPVSKEDFILVIMTSAQAELLKRFGNDRICIDSTHDSNGYDFQLTTLLIVDEFGKGFPVAYCISSKTDQATMVLYMTSIKDKVGSVSAKVFMSDDAPSYYNAWRKVMGDAKQNLLCSWHVDRNWRRQILLKVTGDKLLKAWVYKTVRTLMEERSESALKVLLPLAVNEFLDRDETREFGLYFKQNYASRVCVWAYAYRSHAGINTNMRLEAMHRVLKHIYFEKKKIKRMDECIVALMKMTRDRIIRRMRQLSWNEASEAVRAIRERHEKSLAIPKSDIAEVTDNKHGRVWTVKSQRHPRETYIIHKKEESCLAKDCRLLCINCNVCVHRYTCSCVDSLIHGSICKHIHAVATHFQVAYENDNSEQQEPQVGQNSFMELETLASGVSGAIQLTLDNKNNAADTLQINIESKINMILGIVQKKENIDSQKLQQISTYLDKCIAICFECGSKFTQERNKEPPNKKLCPQRRFYSTKKKRHSKAEDQAAIRKPTATERQVLKTILVTGNENVLNVTCGNADDHIY